MCGQCVQVGIDERIARLAASRFGVVTHAELLDLGASREQIEHRRRAGRLISLHRGVYAAGHAALRVEGRWLAAVLACGPGAVLSHTAAAALWDLRPIPDGRIHVTRRRGGRTPPTGTVLHTTTDLDATTRRGIPVTTPMRTLADLAATVSPAVLARAVEAAEVRGLIDMTGIPPHRPGSAALRARLERPPTPTRSDFEAAFVELCRRHRMPAPLTNHRVGPYEVDAAWPDRRLVVECDSYEHHGTRAAFERDRGRDAVVRTLGYQVLRFTYEQVRRRPGEVVAALRAS